jgi:hypothetical protein
MMIALDPDVHKALKHRAHEQESYMRDVLHRILRRALKLEAK